MKLLSLLVGGAFPGLALNGVSAVETRNEHLHDTATDSRAVLELALGERDMGQKMVHEVPPALRAKLPQEFRQMGFSVHRDFDQIALDAENMKDASHSLGRLSATLQICVSCHTAYQIRTPIFNGQHDKH